MTKTQRDCLIAATHGNAERYHGKTLVTLTIKRLIKFVSGRGYRITAAGMAALQATGVLPGEIGKEEVAP